MQVVVFILCAFISGWVKGAPLPDKLAGVWATVESEFPGERLLCIAVRSSRSCGWSASRSALR